MAAAPCEYLSCPEECEFRDGGGVCCVGGVAACLGVGVTDFGKASGVTGDGAGLFVVYPPFYN